jgi:circadian clock protein KaiC
MDLSKFTVSFLADDIVRMRYVSINGQWRKMLMVVKMRRSQHSIDMCEYTISPKGIVVGQPLRGYRALTSGIPGPWSPETDDLPLLQSELPDNSRRGRAVAKGKRSRRG